MVRDYSSRYSSVIRQQRCKAVRRRPLRLQARNRPSPFWGSVLVSVLLLAIGASFWVNHRIETDLTALADQIAQRQQLQTRQQELQARKKRLLEPAAVAEKASGLGLFPPTKNQQRSP